MKLNVYSDGAVFTFEDVVSWEVIDRKLYIRKKNTEPTPGYGNDTIIVAVFCGNWALRRID